MQAARDARAADDAKFAKRQVDKEKKDEGFVRGVNVNKAEEKKDTGFARKPRDEG